MNPTEMIERLENGEDPLTLSIEKWQDIVNDKGKHKHLDQGCDNCALCETYQVREKELPCHKCPVYLFTKHSGCQGTPVQWDLGTVEQRYKRAKAELEFLKHLQSLHKEETAKTES